MISKTTLMEELETRKEDYQKRIHWETEYLNDCKQYGTEREKKLHTELINVYETRLTVYSEIMQLIEDIKE